MKSLSTSSGIATHAVFGSLRSFRSVVKYLKSDYVLVCWDNGGKNFRHKEDDSYKAHRPSTPDDLKLQFSILQDAFNILGIPQMTAPDGYECDDLIGTIAKKASEEGNMKVVIISSDKDFFQLCDGNIQILRPTKSNYDDSFINKENIIKDIGLEPTRLIAMKSLVGDKSDNIKGVRGVGPKTAVELIKKHQTIGKLIKYCKENPNDKINQSIVNSEEQILQAYELSKIRTNIELTEIPIKPVSKLRADEEKLKLYSAHYEFSSIIENLNSWLYIFNY